MSETTRKTVSGKRDTDDCAVFIVSTPIGNLEDMSPRAIRVLQEADVIAAEDTRNTRKLLTHFEIRGKQLISYQDHNEKGRAASLIERISNENLKLAVVSDAGTPCISDPGYRIVHEAKNAGITVYPIPGPSALTTLVSASGLACDRFMFIGFLPAKPTQIKKEISTWADTGVPVVFFESTRRVKKTLKLVAEEYPDAVVSFGREMTKLYEEIVTMPIDEIIELISSHDTLKGEATVMVQTHAKRFAEEVDVSDAESLKIAAAKEFEQGASLKDLLKRYRDAGFSRQELYSLLLEAKSHKLS